MHLLERGILHMGLQKQYYQEPQRGKGNSKYQLEAHQNSICWPALLLLLFMLDLRRQKYAIYHNNVIHEAEMKSNSIISV